MKTPKTGKRSSDTKIIGPPTKRQPVTNDAAARGGKRGARGGKRGAHGGGRKPVRAQYILPKLNKTKGAHSKPENDDDTEPENDGDTEPDEMLAHLQIDDTQSSAADSPSPVRRRRPMEIPPTTRTTRSSSEKK